MDLRPTCSHCSCAMDMANIRADPNGSGFICRTCLDAKHGANSSSTHEPVNDSKEIFSKKSYICDDCSYTFERNATFIVATCPMCAKSDVHELMVESEANLDSADEIVFQ